jgi:hypothetical protein
VFLCLLVPGRNDSADLFRPLDLSSAFIAVFVVQEDLALAILAEKPFLFLKVLSYRDILSPRVVGLTILRQYVDLRCLGINIDQVQCRPFTISQQKPESRELDQPYVTLFVEVDTLCMIQCGTGCN